MPPVRPPGAPTASRSGSPRCCSTTRSRSRRRARHLRGRRRRGRRPETMRRALAVRGAAGARDRAHQRARHPRRPDRDRAPRRPPDPRPHRRHARGDACTAPSSACARCALILCGALYTAAVDPDEVLRLFRRVSFRSALTATLATRMVPVLMRDSRRLADAQRCRPGPPPSRFALMRAASSGVLDRALDVAAALEVRGLRRGAHAAARPPPSDTRHDLAFAAAALVRAGAGDHRACRVARAVLAPTRRCTCRPPSSTLAVAWRARSPAALLPFADRRGIAR